LKKIVTFFTALLMCFSCFAQAAFAAGTALKGVDVSAWQNECDFTKMKEQGIDFVILRIHASKKDKKFDENYSKLLDAEIKKGAYVYMYATSVEEAIEEANEVIEELSGRELELPLFLDVEDEMLKKADKQALTDAIITELEMYREAGYIPGIYSTRNFLDTYTYPEKTTPYYLWIARWRLNATEKNPESYHFYDQDAYENEPYCDYWQFNGSGSGIYYGASSTYLDLDYGYIDITSPDFISYTDPRKYEIPTKTLKYGDYGDDVAWLQAILYRIGYETCVDGDFGINTNQAVKAFQEEYNLGADGYVGPGTRAKLIELYYESVGLCKTGEEHTEEIIEEGLEPTCTEEGYTPISRCSVCGKYIHETHETIKQLGHKYGGMIIDKEAVGSEDGICHFECERCDYVTEPQPYSNKMGGVRRKNNTDTTDSEEELTLKDCATMLKCLAQWDGVSEKSSYDVNKDGTFNAKDVKMLLRNLSGVTDEQKSEDNSEEVRNAEPIEENPSETDVDESQKQDEDTNVEDKSPEETETAKPEPILVG